MAGDPENGTRREVDDKECIYYDGYWIRYYSPPDDTLTARKRLIDHLTRRTFHHTEPGINTPGDNLDAARAAYDQETDPARKRVNAAMLAGALFNRATDIFTSVVSLAEKGVEISPTNELMRQCGRCFKEALELGKQVKHYSGEEGIDELWGEPLKAFTMPIASFYESRYVKISQAMRDIDRIANALADVFSGNEGYNDFAQNVYEYAASAKEEAETMRSDKVIFHVWPRFVASGERLVGYRPKRAAQTSVISKQREIEEQRLISDARNLISYLSGARVPMPKSTHDFIERCAAFKAWHDIPLAAGS
ncbi:MAG: hypothetical protein OET44_18980 [Gammaproteobacteria bacterium]|nr:hypothetical protein [Gammaproteobacteria bacterium]